MYCALIGHKRITLSGSNPGIAVAAVDAIGAARSQGEPVAAGSNPAGATAPWVADDPVVVGIVGFSSPKCGAFLARYRGPP